MWARAGFHHRSVRGVGPEALPWHGRTMQIDSFPQRLVLPEGVLRPSLLVDLGERAGVYRSAARGRLERLAPDVYVERSTFAALTPEARHRHHIEAVWPRARVDEVLSHRSAAAWWGLPVYGGLPSRPETVTHASGRRSASRTFLRHSTSRAVEPTMLRGMPVTSLARAVVDVAATSPFVSGVVVADAALRLNLLAERSGAFSPLDVGELEIELARLGSGRGAARARRVIGFADGRAQLPGESVSRCTMLAIGCPIPDLQHELRGSRGQVYYIDFHWAGQRIGAEFDGRVKYDDPRYLRGRSPADAVIAEKEREDEIRPQLTGFGRWGFGVAREPRELASRLHRIGLRW